MTTSNNKSFEKIAVLLHMIGPELAGPILKKLPKDQVRGLVKVLQEYKSTPDQQLQVVDEFLEKIDSTEDSTLTSISKMQSSSQSMGRELVSRLLGNQAAEELFGTQLDALEQLSVLQICTLVKNQHPQINAVILCHLTPERFIKVFESLDQTQQTETLLRIARMGQVSRDILEEVNQAIVEQFHSRESRSSVMTNPGSAKKAAELMNFLPHRDQLLKEIQERDPSVADEIEQAMFTWHDLLTIRQQDVPRLLKEIPDHLLVKALRAENEKTRTFFFKGMSERKSRQIADDLDYGPQIPKSEVEAAREAIVKAARQLIESEEIHTDDGEYV